MMSNRIQQIFAEGTPLQKDKIYKVAYITWQGVPEKIGRNRTDREIKAVEAMEMFLKQNNFFIPLQQEVFNLV